MNKLWEYKKIGDVCIVERGSSPRPIDKFITNDKNGINWIKIGDTSDSMYITETAQKIVPEGMRKSRYVKPGDFLLSNSMSFGHPYILKIDGCIHDGWLLLRDEEGIFDKRFLYYYLSSKTTYEKLKSMAVGGVVNNLNSEMVRKMQVPVLSKKKQSEIADLLDKLKKVINERKKEIQYLDELIKARFVELFGDPVLNDKKLPTVSGDSFFKLSNGKAVSEEKRYKVGIPAYGGNGISWFTDKPLIADDTLVVGRVGFQSGNIHYAKGPLWVTDNAMYISKYDKDKFDLMFLCDLMQHVDFSRFQDAGDLKKITQKPFMKFQYILPSIALQQQFVDFKRQVDKSKAAVQKALDETQLLFDSLMQEYFG